MKILTAIVTALLGTTALLSSCGNNEMSDEEIRQRYEEIKARDQYTKRANLGQLTFEESVTNDLSEHTIDKTYKGRFYEDGHYYKYFIISASETVDNTYGYMGVEHDPKCLIQDINKLIQESQITKEDTI